MGLKLSEWRGKISLPFFKSRSSIQKSFADYNNHVLNQISPDSIHETETYVRSGSNYTRTLVVVEYGTVLDRHQIEKANEMSDNISVICYIREMDSAIVKKKLSNSITENKQKLENATNANSEEEAKAQIEAARMRLHMLNFKNEKVFEFSLLIHIVASSLQELESLTTTVKTKFGSFSKTFSPTIRAKKAFDSFLPLNQNKVEALTIREMNAEAVAQFFPFHENEYFHKLGVVRGKNSTTGNVVVVEENALFNKHKLVIGASGVGKSTAIFTDMMRDFMDGIFVRVIDPKADYGSIFKSLGGEHVKFSFEETNVDETKVVNPFDLPKHAYNEEGQTNPLYSNISTLLTLFKLMYPEMTDLQEDVLSKILIAFYGEHNITQQTDTSQLKATDYPTMSQFYDYLQLLSEGEIKDYPNQQGDYKKLESFHATLYAYAYGLYAKICNGHTRIDFSNPLIAFDIFALNNREKAQRVVYFILLSRLMAEITNGDKRPTKIYIDEAHIIADPKVPVAMQYLYFMLKVLRSFNCGVVTATQSITDFLSATDGTRNYGGAVISESIQHLYLPMMKSEIKTLEGVLGVKFSKEEMNTLEIIEGRKEEQAGKGIYSTGAKRIKLEVVLTGIEEQLWFQKKKLGELTC
ncbi:DUF87 domain-containing protein [Bacillus cereus]|uniref:DUF87 domain-containing protein n=1 Tax=Bacillus cereus TaxID=1396 RepID=A0A9X7GQX5_BACCE|nr:DUF87 domain-containing protein [Bacillus cereus]OUB36713.1 TrsE [Bacillus thuringiensis serovar yunnanensis]PGO78218.1 DUF87 domain-containing protein [Bacillus cereus]